MTGQPLDRRGSEDHEAESFRNPRGNEYLQRESGWVAWVEFAGLMLVLLGGFHVVQGSSRSSATMSSWSRSSDSC